MKVHLFLLATLLASPAAAADLVEAPLPVAYDWTGFYLGGQIGGAIAGGERDTLQGDFGFGAGFDDLETLIDFIGGGFDNDEDGGFLGGVHVGYDYQTGPWVIGAVADINFADLSYTSGATLGFGGPTAEITDDIDYVGSGRLRLGYAFDRALIYATGGLAFAGIDSDFNAGPGLVGLPYDVDGDNTLFGYTVGAGIDYALSDNWSLGAQYLYTRFEDAETRVSLADPFGGPGIEFRTDDRLDFHRIEAKISYHFR